MLFVIINQAGKLKYFAIRKGRRLAVKTQQQAAIAAGYDPDRFIDLDSLGEGGVLDFLRPGNQLGIYRYEFIAPVGSGQSRALKRITDRLMQIGVVVEELESGRSCKDPNGVYEIYSGAVVRLSGVRKHDSPGRPRVHEYSDDDLKLIEAIWHDGRHDNPEQRAQAVRDAGFEKFKVSTWYTLKNAGRVK